MQQSKGSILMLAIVFYYWIFSWRILSTTLLQQLGLYFSFLWIQTVSSQKLPNILLTIIRRYILTRPDFPKSGRETQLSRRNFITTSTTKNVFCLYFRFGLCHSNFLGLFRVMHFVRIKIRRTQERVFYVVGFNICMYVYKQDVFFNWRNKIKKCLILETKTYVLISSWS